MRLAFVNAGISLNRARFRDAPDDAAIAAS
jgi:hypothetical protein